LHITISSLVHFFDRLVGIVSLRYFFSSGPPRSFFWFILRVLAKEEQKKRMSQGGSDELRDLLKTGAKTLKELSELFDGASRGELGPAVPSPVKQLCLARDLEAQMAHAKYVSDGIRREWAVANGAEESALRDVADEDTEAVLSDDQRGGGRDRVSRTEELRSIAIVDARRPAACEATAVAFSSSSSYSPSGALVISSSSSSSSGGSVVATSSGFETSPKWGSMKRHEAGCGMFSGLFGVPQRSPEISLHGALRDPVPLDARGIKRPLNDSCCSVVDCRRSGGEGAVAGLGHSALALDSPAISCAPAPLSILAPRARARIASRLQRTRLQSPFEQSFGASEDALASEDARSGQEGSDVFMEYCIAPESKRPRQ
jgi:hypothetical protein